MRPQTQGYTLIELMVALAIVCILSSVALPSYSAYLRRAARTEGQMALALAMQAQERHYAQNNTYRGFGGDGGGGDSVVWWSGRAPAASRYEIAAMPCDSQSLQQCVLLTATPGTARVDGRHRDPECGTLSLSSSGERLPREPRTCWP
ncbi:MAG TPA: type IV pilin protein [Burkholderiaceae bacterium]